MASARISRRAFVAGALAAGPALAAETVVRPAEAPTAGFSLRNARVLLGDGTVVDGGVRVEGGRIVEVGAGVKDGRDLGGATLFPGFYDAGSTLGLVEIDLEAASHDQAEGSDAITPQARVVDAYNPRSELIPVARLGGVLGALVMPAGGALISGQAAWMRTAGDTVPDALLAAPAGICVNLGHGGTGGLPNSPKSRMGVAMKLRDLFDEAKPAPEAEKPRLFRKPAPPPDEGDLTRAQKALRALRKREIKALLHADRADDLLFALDLAKEYALDAVIVGAAEGHLVARQLADAGHPVLLGPVTVQPDGWEHLHVRYENPAILHAAGVRFALRKGSGPHNVRDLPLEACVAVANGLPWEAAIAAVCSAAPGFWSLGAGRLAVGQEATFALANGDPLQPRTAITGVWMRGAELPLRSRQTDLYERFRTLR